MVVKPVFFSHLQETGKFPPLPAVLKFPKLQGIPKTSHSLPLPPTKKKIAPNPTLSKPSIRRASKTLSSTSLEILRTNEATISPTPKLLKTSAQYLKALSIKGILKG